VLILEDISGEVPDTNSYHWDMKNLSDDDKKTVMMYGYNSSANEEFHSRVKDYDTKIFFNNWAPCEFAQSIDHNNFTPTTYDHRFDVIYSICPYSNEWLNSLSLGREYRDIFYPYSTNIIPTAQEKVHDVIYHGGIHGREHIECLEAMSKHNYQYLTMTHHINRLTASYLWFSTQRDLKFQQKINEVAKCKVSICYNIVHTLPPHIPVIQQQPNWKDNAAFSQLGTGIMPQFKTRMHEAAISRTLNLVYKDPWCVADDYYTPDEDFIYFEDQKDLTNKLKDVISDWDNYSPIVESAFQKSQQYTTDKFVEKIKKENTDA
jgi:hypothetical protein